ncbi:MAG: amino acid adenylation domain-containing protein, partial [Planctomycetota bacterium]
RSTLANISELLHPNGFLITLEGVRQERFLDLVFGLTDGWWRFTDLEWRADYPLIEESKWMEVLRACGFSNPAVMDYPVGEALAREYQTVLLAGAPSSGKTRVEQTRPEAKEEPTTAHRHLPSSPDDDWLATFRTGGFDERRTLLESFLRQNVGAVLGSKPEALDIDQPVSNLGIDSLMAIQLKNQLERVLGLSVPMIAFLEGKSIRQLIDLALTSDPGPDSKAGTSDVKERITDTGPAASPSAADPQPVVLGPMSDGQRALWMIYQRSPKSPAYNFAFAARTRQRIDLAVMTTACRILFERHPVLRTLYRLEESQPVRVLSQSSEVQISERDCSGWDEARLVRWIRRQSDLPFDLENGPVIRFSLLRCDKTDVLAIAMHHIAADLWSMDTLIQELVKLYGGISKGEMIELDPLTATYDDYVRWEASLDHTESGKQLWAHWRDRLQDAPHTLALPTTRRRPNEQTFQGDSIEWTISPEVVALLRDLALSERTTMFTVLLTAYQVFLARICEQDDFLVGTISASRGQSEWEGVVGYFLNQLVLRTQINGSPSFRDVLRDSQREILDALEHQSFPFSKLVERIRPPRDASRPPLVQTMFIWDRPRNLSRESIAESDTGLVGMQPLLMEQRGAPFDLTLIVFDIDGQLKCKLRYNTDLFHPEVMESLSGSLQTLMEAVANDPDRQVRSVALLPNAQQEQLTDWNANDFPFEPQKSTCSLFQEWVRRTPNATAIESDDESLSYAEADQRSNSIARRLRDDRVASGDLVAILLPRGLDAIVTMLGVWKTGAAFLALDPNQPTARLQDMLADASPSALVTDASYAGHESLHFECRMHDVHDSQGSGHDFCVAGVDPNSPAYVIYTSGSTGRPKGVVLTHRGLANLASAQKLTFDITTEDRCLQFASLGFDASIFEITMAFHAGACLYVLDPEVTRSSAEQFADTIRRCRVSVATLPPSLLATLPAENLPDLQTLIAAGEVCSAELVRKWGEDRRLFNAYGPTEATVWATIELCECDGREPTIGQPISNTHAYIVDQRMQPMPLGIPGELCLSGPGLAIEYKNMPAATASAFVPNPFEDRCDAVMYRSGDRARWTNDGRLEFLGRRDDQVKLDGYRIEPDEIASAIREWETIENAVVACRQIGTSMALVAYVVFDSPDDLKHSDDPDSDAELDALRRHLASRLPSYLLPKQFVILEQFPVNASGKVDIAALPMPDAIRQRVVAPRSVTEVALVEIWSEVLELDDIGIDDNFFDLGGASLQALQAADLVSNRGMPISAENLFQFQTIRELANAIDTSSEQTVADEYQCDVQNASLGDHESLGRSRSDENVNAIEHQQSTIDASLDDYRMVVESLGTHLPAEIVTTEQVVADCERKLDFPLERMTGIRSRRMAGRDEFSIDLARRAAQNCLANSRYEATELDLIIACNISRYDGPDFQISYEPSTASKLKQQIGASSAVAFDICNACAGFFTALQIAESKLLAGEVRRVMIVSGEYITHLTKTAQREIDGFLDPRLPSLTLGDAGAAVIVELTDQNVGFDALKLYTSASHYDLCIAKATDQPHGGAVMLTKAIKAAAVTLEHLVGHAQRTVEARKWDADDVNHVIMHQTSSTTLDGAIEALNRHFGKTICDHNNTVNNLRDRANTASTTHWVAVMDLIRQG